jgi:enamine deaminase RidA (YjgF/YER057c/UK114 family)
VTTFANPFPADPDRSQIWEMLVRRDIEAFIAGDWSLTAPDFDEESFFAVDARASGNPDTWRITYPSLTEYRDDWLAQSRAMSAESVDVEESLYQATTLRDIEISGDRAVAHKKFDGTARRADGSTEPLNWQTLYHLRNVQGRWRVVGFTGYLPNPCGLSSAPSAAAATESAAVGKRLPDGASQHVTAGPYSPALVVQPGRLVVISGQAAIDDDGSIPSPDITAQARHTLENCRRQLHAAGASLGDVFKVNVYLRDLADWEQFNEVYREVMPDPLPVRTAVGTDLLSALLVEVEMWAVIP